MIGTIDIEIQAANPQMPLVPVRAYKNSPTSVRLRNVPKAIGDWKITSVQIVALYPNNTTKTANCVLVGGVWVGTIEGCDRAGKVESGFTVYASGIDENENPVSNYVLGKGLVEILDGEGTIDPSDNSNYVHLFDAEPSTPKTGDFYPTTSGYAIWQDGEAHVVDAGATALAQDAYDLASSVAASASEINVVATSALTLASSAYSLASDGNELAANAYSLASSGYDLASSAYGLASEIGGQLNLTNASVSSNATRLDTIEGLVPSQANTSNQLADKSWVSDAITAETSPMKLDILGLESATSQIQLSVSAIEDVIPSAATSSNQLVATNELDYALVNLTPTEGDPYILPSMLPIVVELAGGGTKTITDPSEVYMDKLGTEPNQVYDLLWTNGTYIFITLATCLANGIYIGHGTDVDTITFGGNTPVADTTQILDFKQNYTLSDRAINSIHINSAEPIANLTLPTQITGRSRDFKLFITAEAGTYTTPASLSISGVTITNNGGELPEIVTASTTQCTTVIDFTEVAANQFTATSPNALDGLEDLIDSI